jgi:WD40 repeat protein
MMRKIGVIWISILLFLNMFLVFNAVQAETKITNSGFEGINPLPTSNRLTSGAWKPDGSYAILVGFGGTVLKYNGENFFDLVSIEGSLFFDVAWKPDGSYALLGGRNSDKSILKYDGLNFTPLSPSIREVHDIAWKPDGEYALLTSNEKLIRYNESGFRTIETGIDRGILGISWKPDGSYALAVGRNGTILKYDGENVEIIPNDIDRLLVDATWKSDGSSAYIAGYEGVVLQYDEEMITELNSGGDFDFNSIAWDSKGSCALLIGNDNEEYQPLIMRFNGIDFTKLPNPYGNESLNDHLCSIFWKSNEYALIVGSSGMVVKYQDGSLINLAKGKVSKDLEKIAWDPYGRFALILEDWGEYVWKYDGMDIEGIMIPGKSNCGLSDIAWKPDGSYALIVGNCGNIYKYYQDEIAILNCSYYDSWTAIAWHPTENYALIIGFYGTVLRYNEFVFTEVPGNTAWGMEEVAWKPDGDYALIVGQHGDIWRYNGHFLMKENADVDLYFKDVAWKPDGAYALIVGYEIVNNWGSSSVIAYNDSTCNILQEDVWGFYDSITWDTKGENAYILEGSDIILYNGNDFQNVQVIHEQLNNEMDWNSDGSYALIVGNKGMIIKYNPELPSGIPIIDLDWEETINEDYDEDNNQDTQNTVSGESETPFLVFILYLILMGMSILIVFYVYLSFLQKKRQKED